MVEQTAADFVKDRKAALKEIEKLRNQNVEKIKALNAFGAQVDPALLANLKIDVFIQSFLDEEAQLVYRRNLETRLKDMLDEGLAQARQAQIMQGSNSRGNGLILP